MQWILTVILSQWKCIWIDDIASRNQCHLARIAQIITSFLLHLQNYVALITVFIKILGQKNEFLYAQRFRFAMSWKPTNVKPNITHSKGYSDGHNWLIQTSINLDGRLGCWRPHNNVPECTLRILHNKLQHNPSHSVTCFILPKSYRRQRSLHKHAIQWIPRLQYALAI